MKTDLNKPLFLKAVFVRAENDNCLKCIFNIQGCKSGAIGCTKGHWELHTVFPQSETTFDLLQLQDSINSVDTKMKQFKSEMQQVKEEVKEEPKYFY